MNSLKKGEGVPLLNFEGGPGVLLLNFEGGPGVPLLNFDGVSGPRVPRSQVLGSWSHYYTMPLFFLSSIFFIIKRYTSSEMLSFLPR